MEMLLRAKIKYIDFEKDNAHKLKLLPFWIQNL